MDAIGRFMIESRAPEDTEIVKLRGRVITVSDRVAAGEAEDRSGPLAVALLTDFGVETEFPTLVPDEQFEIAQAVRSALAEGVDVVLLTGGTGIGPRDVTPEAVKPLLDKELPGICEAIRAATREHVPTADLSRMVAGTIGESLVLAFPGSTGGVRDGIAVAGPLLAHAVDVLRGGGHPRQAHGRESVVSNVAGASMLNLAFCQVTENELNTSEHVVAVSRSGAGAVVTFVGVVRDHDNGRDVVELEYEAHPSASAVLVDVVTRLGPEGGNVTVAVSHRTGQLKIGDAALVVAVSAAHRAPALATCARIVDNVKEYLPVWKHQTFADGTDEWVNCA